MSYCHVVMYSTYDDGYSSDRVATVCTTLDKAIDWIEKEPKGKSWARLAHIEGTGITTRLITDFSETRWSCYHIEKHTLEN